MGIKLFEFLRRRQGTSKEEFHAYWRDVHGPLLSDNPDLRRHVTRYELNHRLAADTHTEGPDLKDEGWDGVAVLWLESMDALRALGAEPAMAAVRESAPKLHEDERLIVITEEPDVIVETGRRDEAGAKMVCILHRNAALDLDTFHKHWLEHHGGLFQNVAELRDPLLGYDQNHGLRNLDAEFDGVTEQWFESLQTFGESLYVPAVANQVNPDVAYMLDGASIHFVMAGKPTVLLG